MKSLTKMSDAELRRELDVLEAQKHTAWNAPSFSMREYDRLCKRARTARSILDGTYTPASKPVGPKKKDIEALRDKAIETAIEINNRWSVMPHNEQYAFWSGVQTAWFDLNRSTRDALWCRGSWQRTAHLGTALAEYTRLATDAYSSATTKFKPDFYELVKKQPHIHRAYWLGRAWGYRVVAREMKRLLDETSSTNTHECGAA